MCLGSAAARAHMANNKGDFNQFKVAADALFIFYERVT